MSNYPSRIISAVGLLLSLSNVCHGVHLDSVPQNSPSVATPLPALIPLPSRIEWRDGVLPADKAALDSIRFVRVGGLPREGYELDISTTGAVVRSSSPTGAFYAEQTLKQLRAADGSLPCIAIHDAPRFAWRGFMLDSSRHFQSVPEIKHWLDLLAMHKLNVFHWHLTDDHGWRFESRKYPLLTQVGAWREQPPIGRYGGFYSQSEMREIDAYAAKLHITILPEIEMPGHARSALAAYSNLACGGTKTEVDRFFDFPMGVQAFPSVPGNNVMCAGKEETYRFLEAILTEVMDVFPSTYIHVGGDEVDMKYWNGCADCQAAMKKHQLANGSKLQAHFMARIEKFLNAHGRKLVGWDEIIEGGLSPSATVMSWRGTSGGIHAARTGHDAVMSPKKPLYFDHRQSTLPEHPPGFGVAVETLQEVYDYDPVPQALSPGEAKHILGAQANLWTCATETQERLELFAFPRLCALAEVVWCPPGSKNYQQFQQRLDGQLRRFDALGINYWRDAGEFQLGTWSPNPAYKTGTNFELPVQKILTPGTWTVSYQFRQGTDALTIDAVELLDSGRVIATDVHEGTAGSAHTNHRYTLVVPELKAGSILVLRTKAHVLPWSGGGNGDSAGVILLSQAQSVRTYAPELPLPAIRATTPAAQDRDQSTSNGSTRHEQTLAHLRNHKPEIVMLGDSITQDWGGEPAAPITRSQTTWNQAFGARAVANLGCGSDRTENVLWRIDHGELDGIDPKQVVVMIGTNNLELDTPEQVLAGIDAICRRIHTKLPATRILVLGILPRKDQSLLKADLDKVNYLLQTRLHPRTYIDVLDLGNKFRNADGKPNESLFADPVHPNQAGCTILAANLKASLDKK